MINQYYDTTITRQCHIDHRSTSCTCSLAYFDHFNMNDFFDFNDWVVEYFFTDFRQLSAAT